MVEQLREAKVTEWVAAAGAIVSAVTGLGMILLWLTGAMAGSSIINSRLASISEQVTQLQSDLRSVPRADQIIVLDRHLSAQDGRMDSIDTRLRDSENRIAGLRAQLDQIDQSSRATLGHR